MVVTATCDFFRQLGSLIKSCFCVIFGGCAQDRTVDPLIKSQLRLVPASSHSATASAAARVQAFGHTILCLRGRTALYEAGLASLLEPRRPAGDFHVDVSDPAEAVG